MSWTSTLVHQISSDILSDIKELIRDKLNVRFRMVTHPEKFWYLVTFNRSADAFKIYVRYHNIYGRTRYSVATWERFEGVRADSYVFPQRRRAMTIYTGGGIILSKRARAPPVMPEIVGRTDNVRRLFRRAWMQKQISKFVQKYYHIIGI